MLMRPLCQELREYRERKGITQTFIARKTGKTCQRISALESGKLRLTADEFVELCVKGYGVNPSIFFNNKFSKNENNRKL